MLPSLGCSAPAVPPRTSNKHGRHEFGNPLSCIFVISLCNRLHTLSSAEDSSDELFAAQCVIHKEIKKPHQMEAAGKLANKRRAGVIEALKTAYSIVYF
jgi:hypothetical protein